MSQNGNNEGNNNNNPPKVPWVTKVGYMGTGVLIGLVIYPFVRKSLSKIQPRVDEFFDSLTGKAEDFAEKASDIMARAKEHLGKSSTRSHDHDHNHDDCDGKTLQ